MLEMDLTAMRRDYWRRGLATALKGQSIELGQQLGARQIQTSNEERNPMFQLNLRPDFQAQPADVVWVGEGGTFRSYRGCITLSNL